jgi:CheY-like chemotaxis protein
MMELQNECSVIAVESRKSVLVIDDCMDALVLGRLLLETDGFEVFTASSGGEALRMLDEMDEPDLVLLDMQMADMSGNVFLETLDRRSPDFLAHVPIVFYSASDDAPLGKAVGFIRKAGDIKHFLKQVNSYVRLH